MWLMLMCTYQIEFCVEDDSKHNLYPLQYTESFLGVVLFHTKEEVLV